MTSTTMVKVAAMPINDRLPRNKCVRHYSAVNRYQLFHLSPTDSRISRTSTRFELHRSIRPHLRLEVSNMRINFYAKLIKKNCVGIDRCGNWKLSSIRRWNCGSSAVAGLPYIPNLQLEKGFWSIYDHETQDTTPTKFRSAFLFLAKEFRNKSSTIAHEAHWCIFGFGFFKLVWLFELIFLFPLVILTFSFAQQIAHWRVKSS